MNINKKFDLAVIGGGPAGLMAGVSAKNEGADVVVIEKGDLGSKILISGNGRCNFTNKTFNLQKLVENYEQNGEFLYRSFSEFGPKETIDFFESRGVRTKIEDSKVFPKSDKSQDILEVFKKELNEDVLRGEVVDLLVKDGRVDKILVKFNDEVKEIKAKKFLLASGGKSYPHLGSDGFGLEIAKKIGHEVKNPIPGLAPIISKDSKINKLQGVSLQSVEVFAQEKKEVGGLIFTHFGISGPAILNLSLNLPEEVGELKINLLPKMSFKEIDKKLQGAFKGNKTVKNSLSEIFPKSLVENLFSDFYLDNKANKTTRDNRHKIVHRIRNIRIEECQLSGFERSLVTRGGIDLREINNKTMQSKIIHNLFFAGEIINLVGRTGGFNLQLCWSTGRLAGKSAVEY